MEDTPRAANRVKSDQTLFRIINALWELEEAGVTELADHIGITKGAVHKHLQSLDDEQFVVNKDGRYRLSLKFLTVGGGLRHNNTLCHLMKSEIATLSDGTDAIGVGAIEENGHGVFVYFTGDYFNKNPLGEQFDLHKNAVGKSMLAEKEDEQIDKILDENGMNAETKHTITDRAELFEEIADIRDRGFATAQGERTEHLYAVGASVYEPESDTLGAMSIALPENRVTLDELENEIASDVLTVIDEMNMKIKYG